NLNQANWTRPTHWVRGNIMPAAPLARREVDLTPTTECDRPLSGEALLTDPLVWVGARDGRAHKRDPLPVSIGDKDCAFRPVVIKALNHAGRDWRPVCEVSNMEALCAPVEADLAWCRCSPQRCRV